MATNCTGLDEELRCPREHDRIGERFRISWVGIDSRRSASKFKIRSTQGAPHGQELLLTRFHVNYNGFQQLWLWQGKRVRPSIQDLKVPVLAHRYVGNLLQSNAYHTEGGGESLTDFLAGGAFHYFAWPKDFNELPTRVNVNSQFSTPFVPGDNIRFWSPVNGSWRIRLNTRWTYHPRNLTNHPVVITSHYTVHFLLCLWIGTSRTKEVVWEGEREIKTTQFS
jgi:hypothetical protein